MLSSCTMCSRPACRCCSACSCSAAAGDRQVATTRVLGRSTSCRTNSRPRPRLLPCTSATRVPEAASLPLLLDGLLSAGAAAAARERERTAAHSGAALAAAEHLIVVARCMTGAKDQQRGGRRRVPTAVRPTVIKLGLQWMMAMRSTQSVNLQGNARQWWQAAKCTANAKPGKTIALHSHYIGNRQHSTITIMQAAVSGAACWRARPVARPATASQSLRSCGSRFASRSQLSRWRALSGSDGSDAEGGGAGGSGSGDSEQTDEVQELLRLRAQAARLNELFFAPAAPGASDAEGKLRCGQLCGASPCACHASLPNLCCASAAWVRTVSLSR